MQLGRYLEHFDRSQIHVILFEEYVANRQRELDRLGAFLGFDPVPLHGMDPVWSNESRQHFDRRTRTQLARYLGSNPIIHRCRKVFPVSVRRKLLYALSHSALAARFRHDTVPEPMSDEDRRWLWELYKPSVQWMEQFLGRELAEWSRSSEEISTIHTNSGRIEART